MEINLHFAECTHLNALNVNSVIIMNSYWIHIVFHCFVQSFFTFIAFYLYALFNKYFIFWSIKLNKLWIKCVISIMLYSFLFFRKTVIKEISMIISRVRFINVLDYSKSFFHRLNVISIKIETRNFSILLFFQKVFPKYSTWYLWW